MVLYCNCLLLYRVNNIIVNLNTEFMYEGKRCIVNDIHSLRSLHDVIRCNHLWALLVEVSLLVDVLQFEFLTSYYNIASLNS